jgi:hypothetical protein
MGKRPSAKQKGGRYFQLEIPNDEHEGLQRVAQAKLTSMSEILRKLIQAVGLVKYEAGQKLAIVDREGKIIAYVTGL